MESKPSPRSSPALRLFWGIALAEDLRRRIGAWQVGAKAQAPRARWVAAANLHLTLAFLGSRPEAELEPILAAGRAALRGTGRFALTTSGPGVFPSPRAARVLWLGLEKEPVLEALAARLQAAMRPFGCADEAGPYVPHLTLARFPHPVAAPALPAFPASTFAVQELHLFRSETRADGPVYHRLGTLGLSA